MCDCKAALVWRHCPYGVHELLPGGELYKHMTRRKRFTEPETKFFVASVPPGVVTPERETLVPMLRSSPSVGGDV